MIVNQNKKTTLKEYQKICNSTAKRFDDPQKAIMTWGLGLTGEAGDIAGCIKKTYAHDNNQTKGIRENLGDAMWYAAMICNFYKWNMQEVLEENLKKLKKRYPEGFTIKDANRDNTRIDWNES